MERSILGKGKQSPIPHCVFHLLPSTMGRTKLCQVRLFDLHIPDCFDETYFSYYAPQIFASVSPTLILNRLEAILNHFRLVIPELRTRCLQAVSTVRGEPFACHAPRLNSRFRCRQSRCDVHLHLLRRRDFGEKAFIAHLCYWHGIPVFHHWLHPQNPSSSGGDQQHSYSFPSSGFESHGRHALYLCLLLFYGLGYAPS